jgi:hypothetical protein
MNTKQFFIIACFSLFGFSSGTSLAKSVPGDEAKPVVELMPIVVRHEAVLNLNAQQLEAIDAFRKENMPARLAVQKTILNKREQLRMAILEGDTLEKREALMREVMDAESQHLQGRARCADFLRALLSETQYAEVVRLYLQALR